MYISIKECLEKMQQGEVFSFACVKYDAARKKGGEILRCEYAMLAYHAAKKLREREGRELTPLEMAQSKQSKRMDKTDREDGFFVRTVQEVTDRDACIAINEPFKIHPRLMLYFNDLIVVP